ncbi:electron transfer flavoprotein subunit alpha/FixB family protein [Formicincola oecophyllae]|uniref:Electron transfer flavoprotein subunit alpha n=1 Tax=Formicincola oecophyllae TaxID=2558361 RepID=A0A4Y6UB14_9PROT|nr:FAD-binding protein [Formicincola oecophyllae]QDH13315.1 electron transfer flavoprotein subunit alpha/FixB family protein [Formicincola oecophyllae]
MSILVLLENDHGTVRPSSLSALAAAQKLAVAAGTPGEVDAVLFEGQQDKGHAKAAPAAAKLAGVRNLHVVDGHPTAEAAAPILVDVAKQHGASHVVAAANAVGKNVIPRAAGLADSQPVTEVVAIEGADTFTRPVYAGSALMTVRSKNPVHYLTIRPGSFETSEAAGSGNATTHQHQPPHTPQARLESVDITTSERPDLEAARVVVAGGKGLKDAERFKALLAPLADELNAAIGASRAAVDADFAPNEIQVGQTGKIVAPELYVAVAISGAVQHLAGMKDSKTIVAINADPDAPIFQVADYGIVGDAFEIVPELVKAIKAV